MTLKIQFDRTFDPPAPIGTIVIRDINTGKRSSEIRMLLDTGADVTLLPMSWLTGFDESLSEDTMSLTGFDGSTKMYATVDAQIIFLGKRFRGIYCVVDDEIGIIGRDVLNNLSIQFDGPALEWQEVKPAKELGSIS